MSKLKLELWTDGSCNNNKNHSNHGIGGWAYSVLQDGNIIFEELGYHKSTTSSRMELTAVLEGIDFLFKKYKNQSIQVTIYSDSAYVVNCFKEKWYEKWYINSFVGIKNADLWKPLLNLYGRKRKFRLIFKHVKGHSGIEMNERVDYLAGEARKYCIDLQG